MSIWAIGDGKANQFGSPILESVSSVMAQRELLIHEAAGSVTLLNEPRRRSRWEPDRPCSHLSQGSGQRSPLPCGRGSL